MQIILISEKNKCNSGFGLCLIVPSRFFKVADVMIGFTFAPHCDWFVKTSKFLRNPSVHGWLALAVIALLLVLGKKCENRSNKNC